MLEYEKKKALAILVDLGAAKYVRDLDLYHGRAGDGKAWEVDPLFNSKNDNVYKVSALYAGTLDVANKYADYKAKDNTQSIKEVHKIVSYDKDAIIFDLQFNEQQLNEQQKKLYYSALNTLYAFKISEATPVKYEYKDAYPILVEQCKQFREKHKTRILSQTMTDEIIDNLKKDKTIQKCFNFKLSPLTQFVNEFIGAYNAGILLKTAPRLALKFYIQGATFFDNSPNDKNYPYNSSYISAWCANNHVVGISNLVNNRFGDEITSNVLFDTKKIMSEKQHGEMLQQVLNTYGNLTSSLINIVDNDIQELLTNSTSREIMEYINKSPMCKALYDKSAYIWEGWTVGQHTESVIDFFDRYYYEEIPEELKPFMKVVMLAHDIGKGYAKENNLSQTEGNLVNTKHLYNTLNITENYRQLIDFIITRSQDITTNILLNKGDTNNLKEQLRKECYDAFSNAFNRTPSDNEINGLMKICTILQSCDSGAYTRYAKIREGKTMVSGANDRFTASFIINKRGVPRIKVFEDEGM